jgi:hypothetical protein
MTDCSVCFCPPTPNMGALIKCHHVDCDATVCNDCIPLLLQHSLEVGVVPKCPGHKCNGVFLSGCINSLQNPELTKAFNDAVVKGLTTDVGDAAQKKIAYDEKIKAIKQDRLKFIQEKMPSGIVKLAEIVYASRLKRVAKIQKEAWSKIVNESKRTCMNVFCNGILNLDLRCLKCDTVFCDKCEEPVVETTTVHKCKTDDIETVEYLKKMVACPKCGVHIERSEGCDHMTCAACHTNFIYSTGAASGSGSHNAAVSLTPNKRRLSEAYSGLSQELKDLLVQIEDREPSSADPKIMINAVASYLQQPDAKKLVSSYCKSTLIKYRYVRYQRLITEIELKIRKGELTVENLQQVLTFV